MKTTTHKLNVKLEEKDEAKFKQIVEWMARQGLPAEIADSYIYRVGLDVVVKEMQKPQ